jgi:hypothetical protein
MARFGRLGTPHSPIHRASSVEPDVFSIGPGRVSEDLFGFRLIDRRAVMIGTTPAEIGARSRLPAVPVDACSAMINGAGAHAGHVETVE